jgi:FAD dependent oxidoreductase
MTPRRPPILNPPMTANTAPSTLPAPNTTTAPHNTTSAPHNTTSAPHNTTPPASAVPVLPEHPARLWGNPTPRSSYDVVIVGGGGHGLATAYYLASTYGVTNIAVLERGWLAGGNMARNTAIIRSNYLWDESAAFYEHALKLWRACRRLCADHPGPHAGHPVAAHERAGVPDPGSQ